MDEEPASDSESNADGVDVDQYLFNIKSLKSWKAGIVVDVYLDGKPVAMELDTGAALSIMSEAR